VGVHWEARVAGPELMSYGSGSGQVFLSDLTLGFLEDTNQYIVDYSRAGPIVNSSTLQDDFKTLGALSFLTTNTAGTEGYTPPAPPPPGLQRYGAGQGCAFLNAAPRTSFSPAYSCTKQQSYGCTPDNRMSAVCVVQATWIMPGGDKFCGGYSQAGPSGGSGGSVCAQSSSANIAPFQQFFATNAAAQAASGVSSALASTTGGYNNAMDYVPVPVGFWNCMYPKPATNASNGGGDTGALVSKASKLFASTSDMSSFGGQARCPSCRCMQSSLMEIAKGNLQTSFPSYGLCYRTNCYRPDYLQVAVMGSLPSITTGFSFWYACPQGGGKLYIPGYLGSLNCPDAVSFCAFETVTGVLYPEENRALEAVFWGFVTLAALFCLAVFSCPCIRDPVILCTKGCCGVRVFEERCGGCEAR